MSLPTVIQIQSPISSLAQLLSSPTSPASPRGAFGDCYVAITGLPQPNKHHAVETAEFARDFMAEMPLLVHKLEVTLGSDTAALAIRVGLRSGPVTAGVLRMSTRSLSAVW
jgi:class 3 adenylate cyclase